MRTQTKITLANLAGFIVKMGILAFFVYWLRRHHYDISLEGNFLFWGVFGVFAAYELIVWYRHHTEYEIPFDHFVDAYTIKGFVISICMAAVVSVIIIAVRWDAGSTVWLTLAPFIALVAWLITTLVVEIMSMIIYALITVFCE